MKLLRNSGYKIRVLGCDSGFNHEVMKGEDGKFYSYAHPDLHNQVGIQDIYPETQVCFCAIACLAIEKFREENRKGNSEIAIGRYKCEIYMRNSSYYFVGKSYLYGPSR